MSEFRASLKEKLRNRKKVFAGWMSFGHPSIAEIVARSGVDFVAIDMEHSTIHQGEAQRIIAACQSAGVSCLPRPVSHGIEMVKPLLDSGADGMIFPFVESRADVEKLVSLCKFPPEGKRSFGVSRAHGYGFDFEAYVQEWNATSSLIVQIESIEGVEHADEILAVHAVDGVMIGPYDLSGSLGVPGHVDHPSVLKACQKVVKLCDKHGKACGTQIADVDQDAIQRAHDVGYTFVVLSSDLFVLQRWSARVSGYIQPFRRQ